MLPKATPVEEPLLACSGAVGAAAVPLPADVAAIGTVAMVVAEAPELPEAGVVSAGTAAGVPTTSTGAAAVAVPVAAAVGVEKTTCGTVITVESAVVVDEEGMTSPEDTPVDSTHGTVMVVWMEMVVTGTATAGADVTGAAVTPGLVTDGAAVTDGPELASTPVVAAAGALGHPVTIAGF
jgi:hypothetical protein